MFDSYLFRVLIVPSAVFLSVLFGAAYGSGREVVEFISSHGPTGGLVAILVLVITHAVLLVLSFELARLFKAYDYVSFFKVLLGKGWFLYEIVIIVGLVIGLSITTTVGGTVLADHFGIGALLGSLLILALIVTLNYHGRRIVEQSMMVSVVALFAVLAVLIAQLLHSHAGHQSSPRCSLNHARLFAATVASAASSIQRLSASGRKNVKQCGRPSYRSSLAT